MSEHIPDLRCFSCKQPTLRRVAVSTEMYRCSSCASVAPHALQPADPSPPKPPVPVSGGWLCPYCRKHLRRYDGSPRLECKGQFCDFLYTHGLRLTLRPILG